MVLNNLPATGISRWSKLRTALRDAFRTLRDSTVTTSCSRFIVIMLGARDACFSTCPEFASAPCTCVRDMLGYVEQQQRLIKYDNHVTLVIFTNQVGIMCARAVGHKQGLASTLACSSHAVMWHGVTSDDTPATAMKEFTQVSSLLHFDGTETPNI